jgi:hypothetical protein
MTPSAKLLFRKLVETKTTECDNNILLQDKKFQLRKNLATSQGLFNSGHSNSSSLVDMQTLCIKRPNLAHVESLP